MLYWNPHSLHTFSPVEPTSLNLEFFQLRIIQWYIIPHSNIQKQVYYAITWHNVNQNCGILVALQKIQWRHNELWLLYGWHSNQFIKYPLGFFTGHASCCLVWSFGCVHRSSSIILSLIIFSQNYIYRWKILCRENWQNISPVAQVFETEINMLHICHTLYHNTPVYNSE